MPAAPPRAGLGAPPSGRRAAAAARAALAAVATLAACGPRPAPAAAPPTSNRADDPPRADAPAADAACPDPAACVADGEALLTLVDAAPDADAARAGNARALATFQQACDAGSARGCEAAAEVLQDHRAYGVEADGPRAAQLWDRACAGGWAHACFRYGFYLWEGVMTDVVVDGEVVPYRWSAHRSRGLPLLQQGCAGGVERACAMLDELRAAGSRP